jgi:hypothetical protein
MGSHPYAEFNQPEGNQTAALAPIPPPACRLTPPPTIVIDTPHTFLYLALG